MICRYRGLPCRSPCRISRRGRRCARCYRRCVCPEWKGKPAQLKPELKMPGLIDGLVVVGVMLLLARAWSLAAGQGGWPKVNGFRVGIMAALAAVALFMMREFGLAVPVGFVAWVLLFGSHPRRSGAGTGRVFGSGLQEKREMRHRPPAGGMSRTEAFSVLGLKEGASDRRYTRGASASDPANSPRQRRQQLSRGQDQPGQRHPAG